MSTVPQTTAPASAMQIWKEGDSLMILLDGRAVALKLQPWEWLPVGRPCGNSENGLATCPMGGLRQIALLAKERETFAEGYTPKIAEKGSPTQWDIVEKTLIKDAIAEGKFTKIRTRSEEKLRQETALKELLSSEDELMKFLDSVE